MAKIEYAAGHRSRDLIECFEKYIRGLDEQCSVELALAKVSTGETRSVCLARAEVLLAKIERGNNRLQRFFRD